jgi:hypothetical protein
MSDDAAPSNLRTDAPASGQMMAGPALSRHPNGALGVTTVPEPDSTPAIAADEPRPASTAQAPRTDHYRVSVQEYITFREQGYLVVRGLVNQDNVQELIAHTEDLMYGRVEVPGLQPPPPGATVEEIERRYLRIHMLHRHLEIHERFLLHSTPHPQRRPRRAGYWPRSRSGAYGRRGRLWP